MGKRSAWLLFTGAEETLECGVGDSKSKADPSSKNTSLLFPWEDNIGFILDGFVGK